MGLSYRKRVKIAPGVHLNFSKSGISTSFGVKGASITKGKRGTYVNLGIPGTGLSYREKVFAECNKQNSSEFTDIQQDIKSKGFLAGLSFFFAKVFFFATLFSFFSAIFEGAIMWLFFFISLAIFVLFLFLWFKSDSKYESVQGAAINAPVCGELITKSVEPNTNNDAGKQDRCTTPDADSNEFINTLSYTSANYGLDENIIEQSKADDMNLTNIPIDFNGTYKESLPCKYGELNISKRGVQLDFYIPGPDLRYNGSFYHLRCPEEVDEMIKCLLQGWNRRETIASLNLSGSIEEHINNNITVRCGSGFFNGVCVFGYAFVFSSKSDVDHFISVLEQAKIKGELIHKSLFG